MGDVLAEMIAAAGAVMIAIPAVMAGLAAFMGLAAFIVGVPALAVAYAEERYGTLGAILAGCAGVAVVAGAGFVVMHAGLWLMGVR